jgi:hypothetical protein
LAPGRGEEVSRRRSGAFDFKEIYRSFEGAKSFSRKLGG